MASSEEIQFGLNRKTTTDFGFVFWIWVSIVYEFDFLVLFVDLPTMNQAFVPYVKNTVLRNDEATTREFLTISKS